MKKVSRRELARFVVRELQAGADREQLMRQVAAYLAEQKLLHQTDMLIGDIAEELERTSGHVSAEVRAVFTPDADTRAKLTQFVQDMTGAKSVELQIVTDPELIGGVIVKTPGREYDASVRHKLQQLAQGIN